MSDTDNIVLEHLRAIRGDMTKMADSMRDLSVGMTAMRQHLDISPRHPEVLAEGEPRRATAPN